MPYSGWRFSCDRGTLERCAGALEIRAKEYALGGDDERPATSMYLTGAAAALRTILRDGDGIEPAEFVGQVLSRAGESI